MSSRRLIDSYQLSSSAESGQKKLPPALAELTGSALAVYRWLAWRHNDATGQLNPSHQDIAAGTGFSLSTIGRSLKELRQGGLIEWEGKAAGTGRGRESNVYRLRDLIVNMPSRSDLTVKSGDLTVKDTGPNRQKLSDLTVKMTEGKVKGKETEKETEKNNNGVDFEDSTLGSASLDGHLPAQAEEQQQVDAAERRRQAEERERHDTLAALRKQLKTAKGSFLDQTRRSIVRCESELKGSV